MRSIIIGLGETGRPLYNVLKQSGMTVLGYDKEMGWADSNENVCFAYVLNICIPYSDEFIETVKYYQNKYQPKITIIHATVPIGTTIQIPNAVHSPILGRHDNMEKSLTSFTKWIGGEKANEARVYLEEAGIPCRCVASSDETEALKLLCLAKYGMSIAFAQYCDDIAKHLGFNYQDILDWDINYNAEVSPDKQRPLIFNPDGEISGHCVCMGTKLLDGQFPNPILKEILMYDKKRTVFKAWHPVNIYPTAKIGQDVSIGMFSEIGNNVVVGDRSRIGQGCFIPEGVTIEEDCFVGPHSCFCNDRYPPSGKDKWELTIVRKGARIGAGCTILPGVYIGEGSLLGAGSVLTKSIPAGETWIGVPARKKTMASWATVNPLICRHPPGSGVPPLSPAPLIQKGKFMAKIAKMEVSFFHLEDLLMGKLWGEIKETTAPKDLKVIGVEMREDHRWIGGHSFFVLMKSDSFEDIPEGTIIPTITPFVYTKKVD